MPRSSKPAAQPSPPRNSADKDALRVTAARNALWYSGNLQWKLHAEQREIYNQLQTLIAQGHKEFAFRIARQFGKSYLTVVLALELCLKNPGVIVRILGPTIDSVKNIVDDNLQPICADAPAGLIERQKSDKRYRVGKSSLRIGTLERAHIDQTARGGNAFAIFCEECAASVASEDLQYAIESVITPQLLHSSKKPGGGLLGFITTPADTPEHYFHTIIEPACQAKGTYWVRTVYENPRLTETQIAIARERCGGEESESWQREYLCNLFRSDSVVIVPEFRQLEHVYEFEMPPHKRLYTCIDFGGSRDHHHAILYYWDYIANKLCIWDEVHAGNQTATVELIKQFKAMEERALTGIEDASLIGRWADMPGQLGIDLNQTMGFKCSQTAKDDADAALHNVRNMLSLDIIAIHPRCKMTIQTLRAGQWNRNRTDFQRTPELGHCDALDCVIYACRNIDKQSPLPLPSGMAEYRRERNTDGFKRLAAMWSK